MTDLPRFDPDAACAKCGFTDISTHYMKDHSAFDCRSKHDRLETNEHLHRTCERCEFGWYERPLTEAEVEEVKRERDTEDGPDDEGPD